MARQLTLHGYRSPSRPAVLPSTVKGIRRKLGLMQNRSQSHPRRIAGYLTVPQLAKALGITPHWVYHQIKRGTVVIQRDAQTRLYLFPTAPRRLRRLSSYGRAISVSGATERHRAPLRATGGGPFGPPCRAAVLP